MGDFLFYIVILIWYIVCTHYNPLIQAILREHTTYLQIKENRKDIPTMPPDLGQ